MAYRTPTQTVSYLMDVPGIWFKSILSFMPDSRLANPFKNNLDDYEGMDEVLGIIAYFNGGV